MQKLVILLLTRPAKPSSEPVAVPTEANTVVEIKAYLDSQGIKYTSGVSKSQLLALIN